jgi:hypothetical protein
MAAGPAVIVNGLDDAVAVLRAARGVPVTLLSAPGAALFAGCQWWRELVRQARESVPGRNAADVLDCADAGGLAVSALRLGQTTVVLHESAPGRTAVAAIAAQCGAMVLAAAPAALDLSKPGAARLLENWLHGSAEATEALPRGA